MFCIWYLHHFTRLFFHHLDSGRLKWCRCLASRRERSRFCGDFLELIQFRLWTWKHYSYAEHPLSTINALCVYENTQTSAELRMSGVLGEDSILILHLSMCFAASLLFAGGRRKERQPTFLSFPMSFESAAPSSPARRPSTLQTGEEPRAAKITTTSSSKQQQRT